ncbi:hypothetical protein SLE2022_040140 [Rubroshorea leprosula]
MTKTIFENKAVEGNDLGTRMWFPVRPNTSYLPPDCCSKIGKELPVKDENGTQWSLWCKKENGKLCFTDGWTEFREERGVGRHHKISLYKDDDPFGSGAQYKITVTEN